MTLTSALPSRMTSNERLQSGRQASVAIIADLAAAGPTIDTLEDAVSRYSRTLAASA